jgi:hypothetical protein
VTGPRWAPVDDDTSDLLDLLANDERKADDYDRFILACRADWEQHGHVSVQCVRHSLSNRYGLVIEPRTYSSFWRRASGKDGPLQVTGEWETCTDTRGRNAGRPQMLRRWVG